MRRDLTAALPHAPWPPGVTCVSLTPRHSLQAHRLLTQSHLLEDGQWLRNPDWLDAFEHNPEFDRSRCFVAIDSDHVLGVINCWTSAFIKDLAVHPDDRNRGIGTALLHHLFVHLKRCGEAAVDLKVMENNLIARRLYEKSDLSYVARLAVTQN
ncbi:GNAT family N-acetyltransferase [Pseudomonas viridiflava]|uniref:GNAT family N-acetyltransferase n=1 Tax=Pseudomonas viridiflava TaxID=33069 RepID=UPI002EBF9FFF|nr:GNAT family N-acetyltransferase [Pseudomonas viridiflava]MEE3974054.1 GNAT family N-acetyltransferase [Pseudomonas viridiflava]MEE4018557.1 GNAT family N-acetyltransferase [Pseudomonas viridiflava]MEE4047313.1 GNAT family N-acetyltransferase [Pseudomonas viridiflava]